MAAPKALPIGLLTLGAVVAVDRVAAVTLVGVVAWLAAAGDFERRPKGDGCQSWRVSRKSSEGSRISQRASQGSIHQYTDFGMIYLGQ